MQFLSKQGYNILERNNLRNGEADLLALHQVEFQIVKVKTRTSKTWVGRTGRHTAEIAEKE